MTHNFFCPVCASANVMFSKKRGVHIREECNREFTKPV